MSVDEATTYSGVPQVVRQKDEVNHNADIDGNQCEHTSHFELVLVISYSFDDSLKIWYSVNHVK